METLYLVYRLKGIRPALLKTGTAICSTLFPPSRVEGNTPNCIDFYNIF